MTAYAAAPRKWLRFQGAVMCDGAVVSAPAGRTRQAFVMQRTRRFCLLRPLCVVHADSISAAVCSLAASSANLWQFRLRGLLLRIAARSCCPSNSLSNSVAFPITLPREFAWSCAAGSSGWCSTESALYALRILATMGSHRSYVCGDDMSAIHARHDLRH